MNGDLRNCLGVLAAALLVFLVATAVGGRVGTALDWLAAVYAFLGLGLLGHWITDRIIGD